MSQGGKLALIIAAALALCVVSLFLAPLPPFGRVLTSGAGISFGPVLISGAGFNESLFFQNYLPRTLAALLCGAGLAVSGLVFRSRFKNTLASPHVFGLAGGVALKEAAAFIFGPPLLIILGSMAPIAAGAAGLLGCLMATVAIWSKGGFAAAAALLIWAAVGLGLPGILRVIELIASGASLSSALPAWPALLAAAWERLASTVPLVSALAGAGVAVLLAKPPPEHDNTPKTLLDARFFPPRGATFNASGLPVTIYCLALVAVAIPLFTPYSFRMSVPWIFGSLWFFNYHRLGELAFVIVSGTALMLALVPIIGPDRNRWEYTSTIDQWTGREVILKRHPPSDTKWARRSRHIILIAGAILAAEALSLAGPVACVGLMAHRICLPERSESTRLAVLACFFAGGALMLIFDIAALVLHTLMRPRAPGGRPAPLAGGLVFWPSP